MRPCQLSLLISLALGTAPAVPAFADSDPACQAVGAARPVCGFQNPEDLVALPGGEAVLVSEYGAMEGGRPGRLSMLVLSDDTRRVLFEGGDAAGDQATWGDPTCPGPPGPAFSPHGIHLGRRPGGELQLLAVQHGDRESLEFFEVAGSGAQAELHWRGCVIAPGKAWLNSVAALPEGGLVTTEMMPRGDMEDLQESFASADPPRGQVWEWQRGRGWNALPGTASILPNGIEVSPDGRELFVNASGDGRVIAVSRASQQVVRSAAVPSTDNARWAPDGRLLVASLLADTADFQSCLEIEAGEFCPLEFQIVAIDPKSMQTEVLYRNQGAPMGAGTVGLQVGDELLIGSFAGDRILRVDLSQSADAPAKGSTEPASR